MTARRKLLLVLLIPLFGVFLLGPVFGTVEMFIWLAFAAAWLTAFLTWAKPHVR